MSEVLIDLDGLRDVQRRLHRSGDTMDRVGVRVPKGGDYGSAGVFVALTLAAHLEAAGLLAAECEVLATAVGLCTADAEVTDAAQAVAILSVSSE